MFTIAFLSGGRLVGVPFPMYPNRFRGWSRGLGPGQGKLLVLRPGTGRGEVANDGPPVARDRDVVGSAKRINWRPALETTWKSDGRDPAELSRLQVVVP